MQDYYQKYYKEYHKKHLPWIHFLFLALLATNLKPGATVLDVACGSGRGLLWFKELIK
jgi:ubiquinone/menaquinone biosynthesis C-methylase UbiE